MTTLNAMETVDLSNGDGRWFWTLVFAIESGDKDRVRQVFDSGPNRSEEWRANVYALALKVIELSQ